MSTERSLPELIAEHRARLAPIREAAEAGDPEAAAAYEEGLALLRTAEARQAEHDALVAQTASQLAQLEELQAKIAEMERLASQASPRQEREPGQRRDGENGLPGKIFGRPPVTAIATLMCAGR